MRRFLQAVVLAAVLAAGTAVPATSQAVPLPQATTCSGVWVVVDFGSLGGTSTKCATSFSTGTQALKSAGFSVTIEEGFVYKINGKPSKPDINQAYWSYWHATQQDDGSYSDWSYSNLGASSYQPTKGNAEGWRYQSLSDGKVPPGVKPPTAEASTPTPTPSATKSSKPSAKPSATKKPTPSATKPTASATPTASSTRTPTPTPAATSTRSPTTGTPLSTPQPTLSPDGTASVEVAEEQISDTAAPTDSGSPLGAIVAGGLIVAGGAGIGGWWWLKGRKR